VRLETGGHCEGVLDEAELLIVSPGVRSDHPLIRKAQGNKIPVIGEIEWAWRSCRLPVIAVTGSNGKTTVVNLVERVLNHAGCPAVKCGNVGFPFSDCVQDLDPGTKYLVLEISSFQLETIVKFKPLIAVWLNFSQNHLDRHADLEDYFQAKCRIFLNQDKDDHAVLNEADPRLSALAGNLKSQVHLFRPQAGREAQANPNFLAVETVAGILGITPDVCREVFEQFPGVEHRMEKVRTINDIEFINDSKSTTTEAGRWALERIQRPIILICGGKDKNSDFSVLSEVVRRKIKTMIVFGEAREKLRMTFSPVTDVKSCTDLKESIAQARSLARPGECVLLSPMCASFDQFRNFEERGCVFKDIVNNLK